MPLSPFAVLFICLALAVAGPLAAMRYLRPILMQTIGRLCDDGQGSGPIAADFWTRAAYVLAISGTALLVLLWGDFDAIHPMQALRRGLLLVSGGVFASVSCSSTANRCTSPNSSSPPFPGHKYSDTPKASDKARRRKLCRSEERRVGKECRSRWSPYH